MAQGRPATNSEKSRASGKLWGASRHEVIKYPAEELRVRARIKVSGKPVTLAGSFLSAGGVRTLGGYISL